MPWFTLNADCTVTVPDGESPRDWLAEGDTDTYVVVAVDASKPKPGPRPGVTVHRAKVTVAVEVPDADSAAEAAREGLHSPPDVLVDDIVGAPQPSGHPRALSAAARDVLTRAGALFADELREDIETRRAGGTHEDTLVAQDALPAVYSRHYDADFLARWLDDVVAVTGKLVAFPDTYLATTSQELAAHAVINTAKGLLDDYDGNADPVALADELDELHELAFQDWDVLMLFDASMDGIQDVPEAARAGFANLDVEDWFKPFRGE